MHIGNLAKSALLAALIAASGIGAASAGGGQQWILSYEDKTGDDLVYDRRVPTLVRSVVPRKQSDALLAELRNRPCQVRIDEHRYLSARTCSSQGDSKNYLFWYDLQSGVGLGAVFDVANESEFSVELYSRVLRSGDLPDSATLALRDWFTASNATPDVAVFHDPDGTAVGLDPAPFRPEAAPTPPTLGPSFDCAKARTRVELAICGNEQLSAKDLAVVSLYERLRRSNPSYQAELKALQREWLKRRDEACEESSNISQCLATSYEKQHETLMRWGRPWPQESAEPGSSP